MADKMNWLYFALALLFFRGVESQRQCETNWIHRSGFCYLFTELLSASSNWEDAREDCRERSSNLASINSEDIWNWMVTQMKSRGLGEHWIGLRKTANQFYWDDGTDITNYYWANDGQSENPNTCVVVTNDGWREELCTEESYYHICYKKGTTREESADAVVVAIAILASLFVLFILILLAYYMMPETEAKHEKLEKNVKRSDDDEAKQRRRKMKGDLERGVKEDEGERSKVRRKRGSDVESQVGVMEVCSSQNVSDDITDRKNKNFDIGISQETNVKKSVLGTSLKGHENKAFINNDD